MAFVSRNPYTGEINKSYPFISNNILIEKIENSKIVYYNDWSKKSVRDRCEALQSLSDLLRDNSEKYGILISNEMGKPIKESVAEIEKVAWLIDYYTENAEDFLKAKYISADYTESYLSYEPIGGILGIMPWNYPFWQVFRFAIPTLIAGNTVLMKHSPNMPQCALEIENLFVRVLGNQYIYQNLFVDIPQVEIIMEHDFIQGVSLTGSDRAGKSIGEIAGKNIKKSVLELGGNDAFIICKDADIESALNQFVLSRMSNNGQICIAAKRLLVHSDIYIKVKELLIERLVDLKIGNPLEHDTDITCLARPDLKENLNRQLDFAQDIGAKILYQGQEFSNDACAPILLELDGSNMLDFDEEVFGPVAIIIRYKEDKDLVEIVNSGKYGLAASIWSSNIEKAKKIGREIEVGNIAINKMVASDPRIPFGGIKKSGYGREMGEEGIKEFVNVKSMVIA